MCPECDNPETDLSVLAKKGTISQGCKACGFHGPLEVNHKVNTFIIKNPPNLNPAAQGSSLTEGKRSKRLKKGENGTTESANNSTIASTEADTSTTSVVEVDIEVPKVVADVSDFVLFWISFVTKQINFFIHLHRMKTQHGRLIYLKKLYVHVCKI